jgi:threonine dehydratase
MITPQKEYGELAKSLTVDTLILKREDLHPYGSHKGRSIPVMIDIYEKQGISHFAISSSGNAALAAALYIGKLNSNKKNDKKITLDILVGRHITTKKLRKLEQFKSDHIKITVHDRPIQTLFNITKDPNVKGLRQSTDDNALIGYESLGEELLQIPDLKSVFIGTSSGTTVEAISKYFETKKRQIEVHIVQTSSCHPIAHHFINDPVNEEQSIADAIVDHSAIRKDAIIKLLEKNNGSGWIVTNNEIRTAQELVKKHAGFEISTNSALSIAGLMQAVYTGRVWEGSVVCMICGD